MISFVRGTVAEKLVDSLILDVNGVGYEVRVTPRLWTIAHAGSEVRIFTHFHVREDLQMLYGFADLSERDMFRTLLNVSGVGPKIAMAVLSAVTPDQLVRAVHQEDAAALKAPGVGPKLVKRLLTELKSVFEDMKSVGAFAQPAFSGNNSVRQDVTSALFALGYRQDEVDALTRGVDWDTVTTEQALKTLLSSAK